MTESMDKETELLLRLAANHLYLAQFEPLRATLLALRARNSDLALAVLQTIVANSGRFDNVLWSRSCPSPALLTFLSTVELLQFNNSTSLWTFDRDALRLRVEFLLLIQILIDKVSDSSKRDDDLDGSDLHKDVGADFSTGKQESVDRREDVGEGEAESGKCVSVLRSISGLAIDRLRPDVVRGGGQLDENKSVSAAGLIEERGLRCLKRVILDYADVFQALCENIQKQLRASEAFDSGMSMVVKAGKMVEVGVFEEGERNIFTLILRTVQVTHLDAMKEFLKIRDIEGAILHGRFLHLDYGVEEADYRFVYLSNYVDVEFVYVVC